MQKANGIFNMTQIQFKEWRENRRWEKSEVKIIKDNYKILTDRQVQERFLPDRTFKAIQTKRREIGCRKLVQKHQIWTPKEIEILNKHWRDCDQNELHEQFLPQKTPTQINARKMYSGLKGKRQFVWSEKDRETLLKYGANYTRREMKEKFLPDKSLDQISGMRRYFGIKRGRSRKTSADEC